MPQSVVVVLGRNAIYPLFPYKIAYQRDGQSMVEIELFELHRPARFDPRLFEYEAGDQPVDDLTDHYLPGQGT